MIFFENFWKDNITHFITSLHNRPKHPTCILSKFIPLFQIFFSNISITGIINYIYRFLECIRSLRIWNKFKQLQQNSRVWYEKKDVSYLNKSFSRTFCRRTYIDKGLGWIQWYESGWARPWSVDYAKQAFSRLPQSYRS